MNPLEWAKANPAPAAIAGGGALGLFVLARARSAKAAASAPTLVPAATANTTNSDLVNTIQPEIDALARIVNGLPTGPPTSTPITSPNQQSGSLLEAVRGTDSGLWVKTPDAPAGQFLNLGGLITNQPTVMPDGSIYARGGDNAVWFRQHIAGRGFSAVSDWMPWASHGGVVGG